MRKNKNKRSQNNSLSFWGKGMLGLNILAALLLLISYLSPSVDPKSFWPMALLAIAYLPLVVLNACFVLFWIFYRPPYILLSLIVLGLGWNVLKAHIGLWNNSNSPEELSLGNDSDDSALSLRVLSYNVHLFRGPNRADNNAQITEEAIQLIESANPDIICIQEFYTRNKADQNIARIFKKRLGYTHQFIHSVAKSSKDAYGMAIFSKFPIVDSGRIAEFEQGVNSIIFADIERSGKTFRVYNVHLRSFGFQKEDYDFINKPGGSLETNMSSTKRIGSRMKHAFTIRSQQARSLKEHMMGAEIPYIVAGDFNDTPLSFAVNHVGRGLYNGFREKGRGWGVTYNGDFPNFQIDYILADTAFSIKRFEIVKQKLSDHYPVWAELSLK